MKSLLPAAFLLLAFSLVHADTPMETSMKAMSKAGKQLKIDLALPDDKHDKATDLKSVAAIKDGAVKSSSLTPKKAETLPPDQKQTMEQYFQKDMTAFIQDIDTLNADVTGDKWDAARTDFQKLMDDEKAGHKAYRVQKHEAAAPAPAAPAPATPAPAAVQ